MARLRIQPAVLVAVIALAVVGCPQIERIACSDGAQCGESEQCLSGYCFPVAGAGSGGQECEASADGCCLATLGARGADPDCTSAVGVVVGGGELLAASAGEGATSRFYLMAIAGGAADASLLLAFEAGADGELVQAGEAAVGGAGDLSAPVVVGGGDVVVAAGKRVERFVGGVLSDSGDGRVSSSTSGFGGVASVPCALPSGEVVVATDTGQLLRVAAGGEVVAVGDGLVSAAARVSVSLSADGGLAYVVAHGHGLQVIDLVDPQVRYSSAESGVSTAAALDGANVYAATSGGQLMGARRSGPGWVPLGTFDVGAAPMAPVAGANNVVVVASATLKQVTAVRFVGAIPKLHWKATEAELSDVPTTPALLGGDDTAYVGLGNGKLVALRAPLDAGTTPTVAWTYAMPKGSIVGAPLQWADGDILLSSSNGDLARVVGGPNGSGLPWPRVGHDRASSGRAAP